MDRKTRKAILRKDEKEIIIAKLKKILKILQNKIRLQESCETVSEVDDLRFSMMRIIDEMIWKFIDKYKNNELSDRMFELSCALETDDPEAAKKFNIKAVNLLKEVMESI